LNTNATQKKVTLIGIAFFAVFAVGLVAGCGDDENRKPTPAEGAAADAKRQAAIDAMPGLTADQKAMAKARMGGPAVKMPGDDAKEKAGKSGPGKR
jgi:hypothetical protein